MEDKFKKANTNPPLSPSFAARSTFCADKMSAEGTKLVRTARESQASSALDSRTYVNDHPGLPGRGYVAHSMMSEAYENGLSPAGGRAKQCVLGYL